MPAKLLIPLKEPLSISVIRLDIKYLTKHVSAIKLNFRHRVVQLLKPS